MSNRFGKNTYYHYDARNRLDTVAASLDFASGYEAKYQYFQDNLLKNLTQRNGVTATFGYDGKQVNSLMEKKADGTTLNTFSYTYDGNGNQKTKTENGTLSSFAYDELDRISTSSQFNQTYQYDSRGNRKSMTTSQPFDRPVPSSNVTYTYNGDGLLWERTENGQTTRYYVDGDQVIAEATVTDGVATLKARYIRGQGLIAREDDMGKAYYVQNGHGDVVNLMDSTGKTKLNSYSGRDGMIPVLDGLQVRIRLRDRLRIR